VSGTPVTKSALAARATATVFPRVMKAKVEGNHFEKSARQAARIFAVG
jgi:hypothetical protein